MGTELCGWSAGLRMAQIFGPSAGAGAQLATDAGGQANTPHSFECDVVGWPAPANHPSVADQAAGTRRQAHRHRSGERGL